jgi:UDP-N-acetylglucosamine 2-epimerase (non-hydrolysing)
MAAAGRVVSVVGTRPNFVKIAPIAARLQAAGDSIEHVLVHTGQHYDHAMAGVFLEQLGVGPPDHMLGAGSGSHTQQTARVMERLEPLLLETAPDVVLVTGDVNSTLGAALVASQLQIPVGHVEAGLRSFDRTMPEELNRVLVDALSEHLFVHSPEAVDNLVREGIPPARIHDVGNTMVDTLVAMRDRIAQSDARESRGLPEGGYLVVTLHRPALVDGPLLGRAIAELDRLAADMPVIFPVHPRTRAAIQASGLAPERVRLTEPLGYLEFLALVSASAGVLTDSGGIQEETTFLGVPCFTLRANTERPVTCDLGTNVLLGLDPAAIADIPGRIPELARRPRSVPASWDGHAAERIVSVLAASLREARAPAA